MKKSSYVWGLLLILFGGLLLYDNVFSINMFRAGNFWPLIVLGLGLAFEMSYFVGRKAPGLLVPGGILTTIGILFFFEVFTNWNFAGRTWPIYVLSVAIGLFQLYLFSGRPKGLLVPVFILTTVAVVFLSINVLSIFNSIIDIKLALSILLIIFGIFIVTKKGTS